MTRQKRPTRGSRLCHQAGTGGQVDVELASPPPGVLFFIAADGAYASQNLMVQEVAASPLSRIRARTMVFLRPSAAKGTAKGSAAVESTARNTKPASAGGSSRNCKHTGPLTSMASRRFHLVPRLIRALVRIRLSRWPGETRWYLFCSAHQCSRKRRGGARRLRSVLH